LLLTEVITFDHVIDTFKSIFLWLENHSGIIGIIIAIIVGSLWSHKFLMQKRAEAFFGFYTRLLFQIKGLESFLGDNELLEYVDQNKGNIFTLIYIVNLQYKAFNGFPIPSKELLDDLKKLTSQIKNTLTESESNVYPKASERERWYDSQYILFKFCEFMENDSEREITSIEKEDGEKSELKHIVKCRELVHAMNYIKESIEKEIIGNNIW